LSNGKILKTAYVYDGFNRLTSVTNAIGTAAEHSAGTQANLSKYEYLEYDNNGNVKKIRETTAEGIDKLTVLCYDSLNRLISAETADGKIETYAYDNKGNRIAQNTNEILFEDGSVEYAYDEQNRLMSISKTDGNGDETVTNNDYTADGLRYLKVVDGTPTFYIYDPQGRVTNELDDTDSVSASYIWGSDRALAQIDAYDDTYFYLYNGHGDVTQIIDQAGEIVNSYSYDVWGNFEQKDETIHNPFTYFGQQFDESTGLYYLRGRYYDPKTGTFTQEDTSRDGLNWYIYGNSNPVAYIDPTGLFGQNTLLQNSSVKKTDVIVLQRALNAAGYIGSNGKALVEDGLFGANTLYAVKQFQNDKGLAVDGIVGKNTWGALGLGFDSKYENAAISNGSPESWSKAEYAFFDIGVSYIEGKLGVMATGGDYGNWSWDIGTFNAKGELGIKGIGGGVDTELSIFNGSIKVNIPFIFGKTISIELSGSLGSIGYTAKYSLDVKNGSFEVNSGAAIGAGSGVSIKIK
jgi:RHS repeat-associated protein